MNRKNIILALLLLTAIPLSAQKITIQKTVVDVGKTAYQQPVTAVFELRNKSHHKLKIEAVKPDCHCTTVTYPQREIDGHETFQITMTYDARQLGHFNKQAAVISNGSKKPVYLCMKGVVLTEVQDFSATYPIEMIHIYNNGGKAYYPNLMHLPSYLSATMTPKRLSPRQTGVMKVTLHSDKIHDYGLTQSSIYLAGNPGDKVDAAHEINVSAVLLPSFVGISQAQLQYAPKIQLSKEKVNIVFDGKKKRSDVITITNAGRSELDISSLQLFTTGLTVSLGKSHLRPGEQTKLKITALREELQKVRVRPRILMITNDPTKPKVTITIHAK